MRDARVEMGNAKWEMGLEGEPELKYPELLERLDGLLPLLENIGQAAGYLVLTLGAVCMLYMFVPR